MDREVSIRIRSSFQVEGAEEAKAATEGLREGFQALAEAAERLRERFPQAVERLQDLPRGRLHVDVAREALEAGDLTLAGQALYRAAQAGEPEALVRRLGAALLEARRRQAPPEEEEEPSPAKRLRERVEAMLPTIAARIASGQLGQAERALSGAEAYLEQVRALEGNTEALARLQEALGKHREALEARRAEEAPARPQVDPKGALEEVGEMVLGRALGGAGALGGLLARLSRFLGPWGWAALGGGALVGAIQMAGGMAEEGRQEGMAFLELNRALGLDYPTWAAFLDVRRGSPFATRRELADLFYTAREAGQFAAAYGVAPPRELGEEARAEALFRDTLAGLRLARFTGVEEAQVARLLRTGVLAGVVDPGQGEVLAALLFRAVREGTREGVSTAETLQGMERHLQGLLAQGITGTERSLAFYAALLDRLGETRDRALMGEAGARALGGVVEGLTRTGVPGIEVLALRALGLPSAEEVGLSGAEAREYESLRRSAPLLAGRFLLEEARGFNPEVLRRLGQGLGQVFAGRPDLEYLLATEFLGLSYEQLAAIRGRYGSLFALLQGGSEEELRRFLEARPQDVGVEGVARRVAEAGYQRAFLEEETSRLRSLAAAQQELDVALKGLGRATWETSSTLAALARGLEEDPVFGPLVRQGRVPREAAPAPRGLSIPEQEALARAQSVARQALRAMGATGISLGVGARYPEAVRRRFPHLPERHQGLDLRIGGPGAKDPVRLPFPARVARVGEDPTGYGRYVVLESGDYQLLLGHLEEVRVRPGQEVRPGEVVGLEGQTGAAIGPHLHLEIRRGGRTLTQQEEFWRALEELMGRPAPQREREPAATLQIGGSLLVQVQGLPPEMGERVGRRVEEVVREELSRHASERRSPYNEGARRGGFGP